MGLLSKLVTSPCWRVVEKSDHILDMNTCYSKFYDFLKECSKYASNLLSGESPFDNSLIDQDEVFNKLIYDNGDFIVYLSVISCIN